MSIKLKVLVQIAAQKGSYSMAGTLARLNPVNQQSWKKYFTHGAL